MSSASKVLIGGGIAGLVASSMLRDRGFDVDLVELRTAWSAYGVGIIQQSNVVRTMHQASLLDDYLDSAHPFKDVEFHSPDGVLRARNPGQRLAGPQYPANVGVRRSALHERLKAAALKRGPQVRLGVTMQALTQDPGRVDVTFTHGSQGRYDLVIGGDGVYSRVRGLLFGDSYTPEFTGQSVWRYNFPRPPGMDAMQTFSDTLGNAAGLVPLSGDLMYMYVTTREPGKPRFELSKLAALMRERMSAFVGPVAELRAQITDSSQVVYRPMEVVFVAEDWYKGRVLLIGDAAHSTTPHLGQGAGMAIEDAVVLSELLAEHRPLPETLADFMARRYERAKYIQDQSIMICRAEMANDHSLNHAQMIGAMLQYTARPI